MMKVLSLFDGMSCGQIALRELGIVPEVYYASEIDRHAIAQTMLNFPDTVQMGDVERWRDWDIAWEDIYLVMGGSPCQGFSLAGKGLAFDDPRSRLFFVFADILDYARSRNPGVRFLLENVNMKREYLRVISDRVGVRPVCIDSALVSAQRRRRCDRRIGLFPERILRRTREAMEKMTDEKLLTVLSDDIPEDLKRQRIRAAWAMAECRVRDAERLSSGTHSFTRLDRKTWVLHRKEVPVSPGISQPPQARPCRYYGSGVRIAVEQWRGGKRVAVFDSVKAAAYHTSEPVSNIRKRIMGIVPVDVPTPAGNIWLRHTVEGVGR